MSLRCQQIRLGRRDAGRHNDLVGIQEGLSAMGAQLERHPLDGIDGIPQIDPRDARPPGRTERRSGPARGSEPDDDDTAAHKLHQRTLRVERATSASTTLMIQNRTMILGSDHPSFS